MVKSLSFYKASCQLLMKIPKILYDAHIVTRYVAAFGYGTIDRKVFDIFEDLAFEHTLL